MGPFPNLRGRAVLFVAAAFFAGAVAACGAALFAYHGSLRLDLERSLQRLGDDIVGGELYALSHSELYATLMATGRFDPLYADLTVVYHPRRPANTTGLCVVRELPDGRHMRLSSSSANIEAKTWEMAKSMLLYLAPAAAVLLFFGWRRKRP